MDMYIEYKGKKIAIVQTYNMRRGEDESYCLELDCVYLTADAIRDNVDLERLCGFDFVVQRHDRVIQYCDCSLLATCDASREKWGKVWIDARIRREKISA